MRQSTFSDVFAPTEFRFNLNHFETGFHFSGARVAAISSVDKEIDAAWQFLRSRLTRRNALMPISLLPPEILARVFHLLVLDEPPLSGKGSLGWNRVTHVCRHWRQVALEDSSLWAKIWGDPRNTMWFSEMLARAKDAPLDIELKFSVWTSQGALLMIHPHFSHTRQLRLHNLSELYSDSIRKLFTSGAPALEHFELRSSDYSPIVLPDLGGNMLFKGHAPNLRTFSLSLSRVPIPWSLVPRGQLTQLKIDYFHEVSDFPVDLNQLIDLLVNCPSLEILALESCLPPQLTEFLQGQTIHLPHLSRLRLCGPTSRVVNMLRMFKLPSSTALHLNCNPITTRINNDPEGLLLPVISAHFQISTPIEFKSLAVTIQRDMIFSLVITASTLPSTLDNRQTQNFGLEGDMVGKPELVLSFRILFERGHLASLLGEACKMLPISNLEYISMSAANKIDMDWVDLFSCCKNVTTMQATGYGTSSLVQALAAPTTTTNAGPSEEGRKWNHNDREGAVAQPARTVAHTHAAIFPNLEILRLTELDFEGECHPSGILFDVFERGLQQRLAASGAPFKLLRISDCVIGTKHANDLRKLVQDFQWTEDGCLIERSESFDSYQQRLFDIDMGDLMGEVDFADHGFALGEVLPDWVGGDDGAGSWSSFSNRDNDGDMWGDYSD